MQLKPGWTLQPDFQYIVHPGGDVPNETGDRSRRECDGARHSHYRKLLTSFGEEETPLCASQALSMSFECATPPHSPLSAGGTKRTKSTNRS